MQRYKRIIIPVILLLAAVVLLMGAGSSCEKYLSPVSVIADADGTYLYVAETSAARIDVVDTAKGEVVDNISLPQDPTGLVLSADGKTLYATGDGPEGKLFVIDAKKKKVKDSILLGHTPMSPALDEQAGLLYACNRFDSEVAVVDLGKKEVVARIAVKREPVACGLCQNGKALFVANHLPVGVANTNDIAAEVDVIDTAARKVIASVRLPNGSSSLRGLCFCPCDKFAYVTHLLSRYTMPTTQLERGWMNTNAISIIDVKGHKLINTVLLDDLTEGASNPWGITCTPDGKTLCVTQAGTHEVSVIDRMGMHQRLMEMAEQGKADEVPHTLAFFRSLRKRVPLQVKGPRGCAVAGSKLYVTGYYSDAVEAIDLTSPEEKSCGIVRLGPEPVMDEVRKGDLFFNDAELCFQKWQSCASCHPDGRADGLNWDLLNDGMGNPKSTKSMLYSHVTPPAMITGVRDGADVAVRAGIRFIQFVQRPEEDAQAIDAYLKSLRPVESPYLEDGKLSKAAKRGKKLFKKAGCLSCHSGEYYTDMKSYDVGLGEGWDKDKEFDTPTLVEIWRTAPYMYDGRAATIQEMLTTYNKKDMHGVTSGLTEQEIEDLATFVLSQ